MKTPWETKGFSPFWGSALSNPFPVADTGRTQAAVKRCKVSPSIDASDGATSMET